MNVYGKWSEPWGSDPRFKGPVPFRQLRPIIAKTRYTFIIPTDIGWVTSKYWEMIHLGVIPFLHHYYDQQRHLPVPNYLRVSNPKELDFRINELENDRNLRLVLYASLIKFVDNQDYSGLRLSKNIMERLEKYV